MNKLLPNGAKFSNIADIKAACSGYYNDALKFAKREIGGGCYRSRGRYIKAFRDGNIVAGECDSWPWDGTLKSLVSAIDDVRFGEAKADTLIIEGGIDYAATPADWADCNYDPWVAEWNVVVWTKNEA